MPTPTGWSRNVLAFAVLTASLGLGCGSEFVSGGAGGGGSTPTGSIGGTGGGGGTGAVGGAGGTGGSGTGGGVVTLLWHADHETGDRSQWTGDGFGGEWWDSADGEIEVNSNRAHDGSYSLVAYLHEVGPTTDDRGVHLCRWGAAGAHLPSEAYYSAWFLFPVTYTPGPSSYWMIMSVGWDATTYPATAFAFNVTNDGSGMYLHVFNHLTWQVVGSSSVPLPLNDWTHIEAYWKIDSGDAGALVVWQDGLEIVRYEDAPTTDPGTGMPVWCIQNATNGITPAAPRFFVDDAAISSQPVGP